VLGTLRRAGVPSRGEFGTDEDASRMLVDIVSASVSERSLLFLRENAFVKDVLSHPFFFVFLSHPNEDEVAADGIIIIVIVVVLS
jgi:hypothetical protein